MREIPIEGLVEAPWAAVTRVFGEIQGDAGDLMAGMSGRANIAPPQCHVGYTRVWR